METNEQKISENGKITDGGRQMREAPGFFKRIFHSMGAGVIGKGDFTDPIFKQIAYRADTFAFSMGLSKEEAAQVGVEVASAAKQNGEKDYLLPSEALDEYLRRSETFCTTPEGKAYIDKRFGLHSVEELKARELANRIIADMPQLDIKVPGKLERDNFDMGLLLGTGSSWARSFVDPKDFALQREAANLAFSMGMSKTDAIQVGEEVFKKADTLATTDKKYNLNDLLAMSPTFSTYEQGVQYLQRAKLDMAVDQIHENNKNWMQAQADAEKVQVANRLRSQYGISSLDGQIPGTGVGMNGDIARQSASQNGIGNFMGSWMGRILMVVVGALLGKLMGGSNLAGLLAGGAGGLLSPVIGQLINGFGSNSSMAQQGIEQLEDRRRQEALQAQAMENSHERQQIMSNDRGIGDRPVEQGGAQSLTNVELISMVREKGIDGIHNYFGADEKRYNEFLTRNGLNEIARNESKVRLEGGDWLKATRESLAAMASASTHPAGTETGKHLSI